MIKIIFYSLISISIVMANQEDTISISTQFENENRYYQEGVRAYDAKEYEKAASYFKKSKKEYSNVAMQLLWAKSEMALGRINYAISAYERVLMLEPQNLEAALVLIELYKKDGQNQEADEVASSFDDKNLTPHQRTLLSQLMSVSYVKLDKFSARVATKIGYDSNIALSASGDNLDKFANSLELSAAQREALGRVKSTWYSQTTASLSYLHDLSEIGGWFIQANADVAVQYNFSETFFDSKYIKIMPSLGYKFSNTTISLPLYYDRMAYLDQDLVENYGLEPTVSMIFDSKYILNVGLKLNQKRYIDSRLSTYDSNSYGVNSSLYYLIGGSYIVGKLSYYNRSAENENNNFFPPKYIDVKELSASIATSYRLRYAYLVTAGYKMRLNYYDDYLYGRNSSSGYYWNNAQREDTYHSVELGLKKDIFSSLRVTGDYHYSTNITDYYISDYDKHIFSIGLEYNY